MFSFKPPRLTAGLLIVGTLVPAGALAQDLQVELNCPGYFFTGGGYAQTDQTCSIDYSNISLAPVENIEFRLTATKIEQQYVAPELPDGVPGPGADTPFSDQTWRMLNFVWPPAGSPTPTRDYDNQVFSWAVGSIGVGATTELYFHMRTTNYFPDGDYTWTLETFVDGVLHLSETVDVTWSGTHGYGWAILPPTIDTARHLIGSGMVNPGTSALTNARVKVYLPYYDVGTDTIVADAGFDPELDTPVIDPSTLRADLFYRGGTIPPSPYVEHVAGTLPDDDGNYSAPPVGELNAGEALIYDPLTNVLTGELGVVAHQRTIAEWVHQWKDWRIRWDAAFNDALPSPDDNTALPVDVCLEAAETDPVVAGDEEYCGSKRQPSRGNAYSLTGAEPDPAISINHAGCPNGYWNCIGENKPYPPKDEGETMVAYLSEATVSATKVELVAQLPGSSDQGKVADLTGVRLAITGDVGGALGPNAVDLMEIYVSTTPTDYGAPGETDLTSRVVPQSTGGDWVLCGTGADTAVTCDLASLDASAITEVKGVFYGLDSRWASTRDAGTWDWHMNVYWVLDPAVNGTIDGLPTSPDPADMANAAFGTKVTADVELADGSSHALADTYNSEVTRESFAVRCGASAAPTADFIYCHDGFYPLNHTVLDETYIGQGLYNYGTLDNVYGKGPYDPLRMCMPIPHGLKLLPGADPDDPVQPWVYESLAASPWTRRQLDLDEYHATYVPVTDAKAQGLLCVELHDYTLSSLTQLHATNEVRILPGVDRHVQLRFADGTRGTVFAYGNDGAGNEIEHHLTLGDWITIYVTGIASMTVSEEIWPSQEVGPLTEFCYDQAVDAHAFLADGSGNLDPQGATLSSTGVVLYQWIGHSEETPPPEVEYPGDGKSAFTRAWSDDALGIWVTDVNEPDRGDSSVLGGVWKWCAGSGQVCDEDALSGLGLLPEHVRWVALEYGEVRITDAEPRGQAPLDGNIRLNAPYTGTVCATDAGSPNEGLVRAQIEIRSVETPYSLVQGDIDVIIQHACDEPGQYALPETCDGEDEDCDGETDEDFPDLGDTCTAGQGICQTAGTIQCAALGGGTECVADTPITPGTETCNGLDDDCDGTPDQHWPVGQVCTIGVGVCEATGLWVCMGSGEGAECDAEIPGVTDAPELCNGLDDDCDGHVDVFRLGLGTVHTCADQDGDGMDGGQEVLYGTHPFDDDTDDDGITDGAEVFAYDTDPLDWDSDDDGLSDGVEVGLDAPMGLSTDMEEFVADEDPNSGTDPLDDDTDDDGLLDGTEDADQDGAVDDGETDPSAVDSDEDGIGDGTESGLLEPEGDDTDDEVFVADTDPNTVTDPVDDDTDDDGLLDGTEDADADGEVDAGETDPNDPDTDGDEILDGTERGLDWPEGTGTDLEVFVPDADPISTTDPLSGDSDGGTVGDGVEDTNHNGAFEPDAFECDPNDDQDDLSCPDSDQDGIPDSVEIEQGGGVFDSDSDDDGISDGDEQLLGTDWLNPDTDGDCVPDGMELLTDPLDDDSDDDGLLDGTEDADCDGVVDPDETDPNNRDTDGDGVQDGTESGLESPEGSHTNRDWFVPDADPSTTTDPLDPDSDGGGVDDGVEDVDGNGRVDDGECDPGDRDDDLGCPDSDGDGVGDYYEWALGTDPNDADSDDDGLSDGTEIALGTDPNDWDTDDDGVQDGTEVGLTEPEGEGTDLDAFIPDDDPSTTTDPLREDTDLDGRIDGEEDANHNGAVDDPETDPNDPDTDGDGVPDGEEVRVGTDPLAVDIDAGRCDCSTSNLGPWPWFLGLLVLLRRRS
ncbi:MAG: hypothetical protein JRI25_04115 [Deltaproteobacteria bacterium]|nr:hypothetical protein [Deltaproteobacteria bacterium]